MSTLVHSTRLHSPLGPITLAAQGHALTGLWFDTPPVAAAERGSWLEDAHHPVLMQARQQLEAYFAGERKHFDLELAPQGSAFQQTVWAALREVGFGQTATYGQLARAIGKPRAARAVGAAVGANPLSIVIGCHRIIGSDGSLTGYAGGLTRKMALLDIENRGLPKPTHLYRKGNPAGLSATA
ncbi:MAG TPA: methylated-DNA--[protein]-cysteine S-methyltransferase [Burkholderiaceae bacterium]|nr:methylated-DNA--[protein]-cysteine S-methyltransferase [Burkholderiaceae bacterium]